MDGAKENFEIFPSRLAKSALLKQIFVKQANITFYRNSSIPLCTYIILFEI